MNTGKCKKELFLKREDGNLTYKLCLLFLQRTALVRCKVVQHILAKIKKSFWLVLIVKTDTPTVAVSQFLTQGTDLLEHNFGIQQTMQ